MTEGSSEISMPYLRAEDLDMELVGWMIRDMAITVARRKYRSTSKTTTRNNELREIPGAVEEARAILNDLSR